MSRHAGLALRSWAVIVNTDEVLVLVENTGIFVGVVGECLGELGSARGLEVRFGNMAAVTVRSKVKDKAAVKRCTAVGCSILRWYWR